MQSLSLETGKIDRAQLAALAKHEAEQCVSIYVPMLPPTGLHRENGINFKNEIDRAERLLRERDGAAAKTLRRHVSELRDLALDDLPIGHGSEGIALLLSPDHAGWCIPVCSLEHGNVVIGSRFYLKPLIRDVVDNPRFRVLVLSSNDVQVYEGDRYGLEPVEISGMPKNQEEALGLDDEGKPVQWHTETAVIPETPGGGDRSAMFHGHGTGKVDQKMLSKRFCEIIDNHIRDHFRDQRVPMFVAAAEPMPAIYREANHYENLRSEPILGNADPDHRKLEALQDAALETLEQDRRREEAALLDKLQEAVAKGAGTKHLSEVLPAASQGRVASLVLSLERDEWGRYNGDQATLSVEPARGEHDEELTNFAALETLNTGGDVHFVGGVLPPDAPVQAILRW